MQKVQKALVQASVDPAHWRNAASAALEFTGSSDIHIFSIDKRTGASDDLVLRAPEAMNEFADVVQKSEVLAYAQAHPHFQCFTDYDFVDEAAIRTSEFYNWASGYDAKYRVILRLLDSERVDAGVAFLRSESLGHATEQALERVNFLAPQLRLAAEVSHQLTRSTIHLERLVESLESARTAGLVLSGSGTVAFANQRARAVMAGTDGISSTGSGLALSTSLAQRRFARLVANAANASLTNDIRRPGGRMVVRRPSGLPPYQLLIAGLPATDPFLDLRKPWVLALIIDPATAEAPTLEVLRQGYQLTPVEAEIATRFAVGGTLEMIAEERSVTLGTLRVQFKGLMAKMGVRRQADLMRLLTMLSWA